MKLSMKISNEDNTISDGQDAGALIKLIKSNDNENDGVIITESKENSPRANKSKMVTETLQQESTNKNKVNYSIMTNDEESDDDSSKNSQGKNLGINFLIVYKYAKKKNKK